MAASRIARIPPTLTLPYGWEWRECIHCSYWFPAEETSRDVDCGWPSRNWKVTPV